LIKTVKNKLNLKRNQF